ncbi:MAG: oligosaccharide flippase family protein [Gaiellaceae bacterium]
MLRQIALTAGTRVGLIVFGLATSIVTARFLGSGGRGDYFFMVTLGALIAQFANLGLPVSNTYFAARDPQRTPQLVANALWISLGVGGGIGVGVALFAHAAGMLQDTPPRYLWIAAALAPPSLFYLLATAILIGRGQIRSFNALELAFRAVLVPALVAAGLVGLGASGFVAVSVVVWVAGCAAAALLVGRYARLAFAPSRELLVVGFRYATKSYLITLLAFVALRGNIFLLRREFGPADLGLYSIAVQIADVLTILPQAVALILFPHLVRDASERWERTLRAAFWVAGIMVVVCALAAVFSGPVIRLLYGDEFELSTRVLQIMLPSVFALAVSTVLSQYLGAIGVPRPLLGVWAAGVALVLALSFWLIPDHGAAGAAAAISAANLAILGGVAVTAYVYRNAEPRGPRPLADGEPVTPA